ncbi:MAG: ligand-binding sensor domain-containing protein [Saprospiraceae bacterium]
MLRQKLLYLFILSLLFNLRLVGQDSDFKFERFGVQEGLSQGTVWDILQDSKGFWWFATSDGLNRYDGYEFHTYHHHEEEGPTSLTSGDIRKLYLDRSGDIWCFFRIGGCSKYNHITDKFMAVKTGNFDMNAFYETENGKLWCHDVKGNIECIDRESAKAMKSFTFPADTSQHKGKMTFVPYKNNLLVFTKEHQYIFDSTTESWSVEKAHPEFADINCNFTSNGKMYFGTTSGRLLICNENLSILKQYIVSKFPILKITSWPKGILLATDKGLINFTPASEKTTLIKHDPNDLKSLSTNQILSIASDIDGNLWVGTNSAGVNKLIPNTNKFSLIPSENYYYIKAIIKKKGDNNLYCSVLKKGIEIYDLKNPEKPCITIPVKQYIFKIEQWGQAHLLLFAHQSLQLLNIKTHEISTLDETLLAQNGIKKITAVCRLSENQFLVGSGGKLYVYEPLNRITAVPNVYVDKEITCLATGDDNSYYVGTKAGLFFISKSGQLTVLAPSVYCKHILRSSDNTFWIATTSGLYQSKPGQSIKLYNKEKYGLANDFIYGVLEGAGKTLWLSHNRGISRLNISKSIFKNFTLNNNLQSYEFNTGAFFRSEDSLIIFGGVRGINYFKENNFFDNPVAPIPIISKVRVNDYDYPTDTIIWYKKYLSFPYGQNTLSFEFTGLQFSANKTVQYFYKLEGIDKDWIYASGQRFARYPKIPPGDYAFKVRAANDDGKESQQVATLYIHIITPIYMRWWFYLICAMLFVASVAALVYYWQRRKSRKQEQAFQLLNQLKNERERISRDLHDNVGAQITYLISSMDWATGQLSPEEDHLKDRLLNLRSNAQNMMSSIRDTIWALNKEEITVQDFADRLKQYIIYQIRDNSSLVLSFHENIISNHTLYSNTVLGLFRIGQEAIQNIIKHSQARIIDITIECGEDETLLLIISDNGVGFDPNKEYVENFGLDNMRFRAKEIDALLEIRSDSTNGTSIQLRKVLK